MAEIGKTRWGLYKKNVLEILVKNSEGLHWKDLFEQLEVVMPATEFENANYESTGKRRRPYIVRFSTIALVKAGWLIKDQGNWSITDAGKQALIDYKTPEQIQEKAGLLYREWRIGQPEEEPDPENNQEIEITVSSEEATDTAMAIIFNYLSKIDPYKFQNLIGALLKGMGYYVSWIAPVDRMAG